MSTSGTSSAPARSRRRGRRLARTAIGVGVGLTVLLTGIPPASAHTVRVFADPAGATYDAYQGPSTKHVKTGSVAANQQVVIVCTTNGESVTGRFGPTTVWDFIRGKGYVSDAYINTGQAGAVGPQCSSATNHYDDAYLNTYGSQPGLSNLCNELRSNPMFNPPISTTRGCGIYSDRPGLHREGRALDYSMNAFLPAELAAGNAIAEYLKVNAKEYGVQEIFWNDRAWDMRNPGAGWSDYDEIGNCGDTSPRCKHQDHLHIGMNWAGAMMKSKHWEMIIDNYNIRNDQATTRIAASANWTPSTYDPNHWATGYQVATAQEGNDSDNFTFSFYLTANEPKSKRVQAWWTSGTSRNSMVPFVVRNAQGVQLNRVFVDQKVNGGRWNSLGTYNFTEGWNSISVSRSTNPANGQHIIADAVRISAP